jgi:hypothetical protein
MPEAVPPHRGRIQVQGDDMDGDPSYAWASKSPIPKAEAHRELGTLQNECTASQRELRTEAFTKAGRFIDSGPIRAETTPVLRTFQNRNLPRKWRKSRVDIEVIARVAFI